MKKSLLLLALSLGMMGVAEAQNANGHFSMRFSGGVAETNLEAFCRTQLPKLCAGSTFEVTRDRVDQQGYRHVTMQQFVNGVRANGMTLNVHVFNGKITSINGTVLTQDMVAPDTMKRAPRPAAQVFKMAGLSDRLADRAELVWFKKDGISHLCYRVMDGVMCKHIDAFTGEVISDYSLLKNEAAGNDDPVPAKGKGQTIFSGIQDIDIATMDNEYALIDLTRGIYTLNSSLEVLDSYGFTEASEQMQEITEILDYCDPFVNDSPDWLDPTFKSYLETLTFETSNPDYAGYYVYAEVIYDDQSYVSTEPVLIEGPRTVLTLPSVIDHDDKTVLGAGAFIIDPQSGEVEQIGKYAYLPKGSNCKTAELEKDETYLTTNSYFTGYAPAIDIHWGVAKVWDYYHDVFSYNSFDGNGTQVFCLVNPPEMLSQGENACALPLPEGYPGMMMYGLGGAMMNPVVDFTVTGHEFTHLVARKLATEANDTIDLHATALNESFADIMAISIYRHVFGKEIWGIGANVMRDGNALRLIDNPEQTLRFGEPAPFPSCYLDENFDVDSYEPHKNSTVQSHMFYLLVTGGEGINSLGQDYAVTPIDRTEAEKLAFTTVTEYVDEYMTYEQVPDSWITAAIQLFGENSPQVKSVCQAWAAVGLPQGDIVTIEKLNQDNNQKRGLRYNLQGQRVGNDYTGVVIEL